MRLNRPAAWRRAALTLVLLTAAPGADGAFPLVVGGRAAPIWVPAGAGERVLEAALDLQAAIDQATGATPEWVTVDTAAVADRPAVLIGEAAGLDVPAHEVGYDGYRTEVTDTALRLAGAGGEGTANAIYGFLAAALGVRYLVPGTDGIDVPDAGPNVWIPATDTLERPDFEFRHPWFNGSVEAAYTAEQKAELRRWVRRNRGGGLPVVIGHYFHRLVPATRYFTDHPEYFAEVGGERLRHGQLCTAHPDVVQLAAEHWIDRFDRQPELAIGSLSPNDGGLYCDDERCRARATDPSTRLLEFMNATASRVASTVPARQLSFYAYGPLTEPPADVALHPGLVVGITRYLVCQAHAAPNPECAANRAFRDRALGWAELASSTYARDFACWWRTPDLGYGVLAANTRFYRSIGARGISREYLSRGFGADLMRYVDAALMWDAGQDPEALVDTFLTGRFGAAAATVRGVVDRLRQALEGTAAAQRVGGGDAEVEAVIGTDVLEDAASTIESAAAGAVPPFSRRLAEAAATLRASLAYRRVTGLETAWARSGNESERLALLAAADQAAAECAGLEAQFVLGSSFRQRIEAVLQGLGPTVLHRPITGTFHYEDDLAHGGDARRLAADLDGFYQGTYGLALAPGRAGRVAYTLRAAQGHHFDQVRLAGLVFKGDDPTIEIVTSRGTQPFSIGRQYNDLDRHYDLSDWVRGATWFTVVFSAENRGDTTRLCLDHWGIRGTTVPAP